MFNAAVLLLAVGMGLDPPAPEAPAPQEVDYSDYVYGCQSEKVSRMILDIWRGAGEDARDYVIAMARDIKGKSIPDWSECVAYNEQAFSAKYGKALGQWDNLEDTRFEGRGMVTLYETKIRICRKVYRIFTFVADYSQSQ